MKLVKVEIQRMKNIEVLKQLRQLRDNASNEFVHSSHVQFSNIIETIFSLKSIFVHCNVLLKILFQRKNMTFKNKYLN